MPAQSIWMIRISLLCLLISVFIGGLLFVHKAIHIHPMIWAFLPLHYELAIWGWLVQFVMGTAYWMFPRFLKGERRGPALPAWIMVCLYNTGLILLATSALISASYPVALSGRALIGAGVMIFAGLTWRRVVSYRNR